MGNPRINQVQVSSVQTNCVTDKKSSDDEVRVFSDTTNIQQGDAVSLSSNGNSFNKYGSDIANFVNFKKYAHEAMQLTNKTAVEVVCAVNNFMRDYPDSKIEISSMPDPGTCGKKENGYETYKSLLSDWKMVSLDEIDNQGIIEDRKAQEDILNTIKDEGEKTRTQVDKQGEKTRNKVENQGEKTRDEVNENAKETRKLNNLAISLNSALLGRRDFVVTEVERIRDKIMSADISANQKMALLKNVISWVKSNKVISSNEIYNQSKEIDQLISSYMSDR